MKTRIDYAMAVLFVLLVTASYVQAASFDCAKASTKIEKMICGDAELSKLDEELNAAYKSALKSEQQATLVKQAQKQWIKERNSCADAACVKRAYVARLQAIPPSSGSNPKRGPSQAEKDNALLEAVQARNKATVDELLAMGADVNTRLSYFESPEARWPDESTPLHIAASWGDVAIVELLLAKGADFNARGSGEDTPLHSAAALGHKEIVELLLAKGADINARNQGGTPLYGAVSQGRKEMIEFLLSKGADVNAHGGLGDTPLHAAVDSGNKQIVELLLAKGADINAIGYLELMPLHKAASERHK